MKGASNADVYAFKREVLAEFEALSEQGYIDLLYGELICCTATRAAFRSCRAFLTAGSLPMNRSLEQVA